MRYEDTRTSDWWIPTAGISLTRALSISDIVTVTKEKVKNFSGFNPAAGLGEKTSDCLDVMEGACYFLCEEKKRKSKGAIKNTTKVENLIQGSVNDFNSILASKSDVTISVAVCGPTGVGKSYVLNFLLNYDLLDDKVYGVPLPSADGDNQTPLPIRLKYRNSVKVSYFKTKNDPKPEVWHSEELLSKTTPFRINSLLKEKFTDTEVSESAGIIEIEGPFPIFRFLKYRRMTSRGHLDIEVNTEFVDLPGLGAEGDSGTRKAEMSNADVVLFFQCGQSGCGVTPLDLKNVFCNHHLLEYASRPKLALVVNCRSTPPDFSRLSEKTKEDLSAAWKPFLKCDEDANADYRNAARAKLPHIGGEELLERLRDECEVLIFHPENTTFPQRLKEVIEHHVNQVIVKTQIHPVLKCIHPVAKKLKRQTSLTATLASKRESDFPPNFELYRDKIAEEDLVESFRYDKVALEDDSFEKVRQIVYEMFLYSPETISFLLGMLQVSLEHLTTKLKVDLAMRQTSKSPKKSNVFQAVTEMLCSSRVQTYCQNNALDYLRHVLDKVKNKNPLATYRKEWRVSCQEDRKHLPYKFSRTLLERSIEFLAKSSRDSQDQLSPFKFKDILWKDLTDLPGLLKFDAPTPQELLQTVRDSVEIVVKFCTDTLSKISPHPSVEKVPLPETPKEAFDAKDISMKRIDHSLREMRQLLEKGSQTKPVGKLEKKLNLASGTFSYEGVDETLWAKLLVDVLCDDDHFQINLGTRLLNTSNTEVRTFLPLANKYLFAYQRSRVRCKVVEDRDCPDDQIILTKTFQEASLEARISKKMLTTTQQIVTGSSDITDQIAPVFIPLRHPGPIPEMTGNVFLQDDPWAKEIDDKRAPDEGSAEQIMDEENQSVNIFLLVEPQHLQTCKDAMGVMKVPSTTKVNYVVLPGDGCEVGVVKAIVKLLADCLNFQLFWIIDDNIKSMYQYDQNSCTWNNCSIHRGLLFGQSVFHTCRENTLKAPSEETKDKLCEYIVENWPKEATRTMRAALALFSSEEEIADIQRNTWKLCSPFSEKYMAVDCEKGATVRARLDALKPEFEKECKSSLFENVSNYIGSVSIGQLSTRKYDYNTKFPTSHFKRTDQGYKMVLLNLEALKWMNFVPDDMIFDDQELKVSDYPGIKNIEKSFNQALAANGVSNFQVICFTHDDKRLASPLPSRC